MIDTATWGPLETTAVTHGAIRIRLHPQSRQDIFLAVAQPSGRRRLILEINGAPGSTVDFERQTKAVRLIVEQLSPDRAALVVELVEPDLAPVFDPLVSDIADNVAMLLGPEEVSARVVERFEFWRDLLRDLQDGSIGTLRRRGLFGELSCLRDFFVPNLAMMSAVQCWTGPTATNQDFQFPAGAVEVKTTATKQPQSVVVTNERELDAKGVETLLLIRYSIDERRGGSGESLNETVDSVRQILTDPAARTRFDELLARVGYLPGHRGAYDEPRYTIRNRNLWDVHGDFPRIVESDLRDGVGDVRYHLATAGLSQYEMTALDVAALISRKGGSGVGLA